MKIDEIRVAASRVVEEVTRGRLYRDDVFVKGGDSSKRLPILVAEVGEAAAELNVFEGSWHHLSAELVQIAATCVAWIAVLEEEH